ncbi:hypothetical protein BDR06DRAFT_973637, partial [Suillus hirtellus]
MYQQNSTALPTDLHNQSTNLNMTVAHLVAEKLKDFIESSLKTKTQRQSKNVANDHPALKPIIHMQFFEFCGVDWSRKKTKCACALGEVMPLENGQAYKEIDTKQIWYQNWMGNIDDECLCNGPVPKSEIPDADFNAAIITECMKGYFRNIHKQAQKAQERKDESCQQACRQTVTKNRCKIAAKYEKDTGNLGALMMIDTDFASEILLYCEDKAGVGRSANMIIGYEWRDPD